jgi:branched-chain amino acid transport system substrate-binding protein
MENEKKEGSGISRRNFLKTSAAVGAAATITGFPAILRGAAPKEIIIGSIQPVTGPLPDIGLAMQRGNKLAADEINARGGIKSMGGAKLKLLLGDCEAKEEVGRTVAERQLKEGAVCLVGPFLSGVAMAIATLAEQRNVPFVIDVAALDAITAKGYKNVFRCFAKTEFFMSTMARYLDQIIKEKKVNIKRIAVTNAGDAFGRGQGAAFVKYIKDKKLPFDIVEHIEYPLGVKDLSAEVAKIKASKPDLLCPVARPGDAKLLIREMYKQRVELLGIISPGSPGWYEPEFVKDMDKLAYYVLDNVPWYNPKSKIFQEANARFEKLYPGKYLDCNSGYSYTAVLVIADALERAKSTDPEALREALRKTHFKDTPMIGGPVVFDEKGDNINAVTAMVQVLPDPNMDDRVKVVLPKEAAQAPYVFPWKQLWERGA